MTILALGAHPDDLEILCAGTLSRYRTQGHRVVLGSLTNGDMGHPDILPDKMSGSREAELRESAKVFCRVDAWYRGTTVKQLP